MISLLHTGFHIKEFGPLCLLCYIIACIFHCFLLTHFYNLKNADDTKQMLRVAESIFLLVLYFKMHSLSIPLVQTYSI